MRIKRVDVYRVELKYVEPFRIALGTSVVSHNVVVRVTSVDGAEGWGEGSPSRRILGDTIDMAVRDAGRLASKILELGDVELEHLHEIAGREEYSLSAVAALDMALCDLKGKLAGTPIYRLFGGYRESLETDITIGIMEPEEMVKRAVKYVDMGFKALKLKLGEDPDTDIERVRAVRDAVGEGITIRVDANQGWTVEQAIRVIDRISGYDVELVEQPVRYDDVEGLAKVRKESPVPIAADESAKKPSDVVRLARAEAVDIVNIKLMKAGGIWGALKVAAVSEACGIKNMVGCMGESRLGITAGVHFALATRNVVYYDLDSDLLLAEDIVLSGGASIEKGVRKVADKPGLGITSIDQAKLRKVASYER